MNPANWLDFFRQKNLFNMKYTVYCILFTLLFSTILLAQESIDKKLVGFWKSSIYPTKNDPIKGNALMSRNADGTFILYLELIHKSDSIYAKQTGSWTAKDGIYTEMGEEYNDEYTYKIAPNQINFEISKNRFPLGFRSKKFLEEKATDQSNYYEDRYSIFKAKTLQKMLDIEDKMNGFTYDSSEGIQDNRFVGVWIGIDTDFLEKGMSKTWEIIRNNDGTFILNFKIKSKNADDRTFVHKGKWWIKDEKLYQYNEVTKMTNIYIFEIINENKVKYTEKIFYINYQEFNKEFIENRK
ncbi:hypothetical protein [Empedobacter brevis]|uniref:hypothetical protein n=1 Tax=Empedobacter brevis TaxID=247 RepID=UPI0028969ECF|nr:hypothetical protein [Empedobacter brevis]